VSSRGSVALPAIDDVGEPPSRAVAPQVLVEDRRDLVRRARAGDVRRDHDVGEVPERVRGRRASDGRPKSRASAEPTRASHCGGHSRRRQQSDRIPSAARTRAAPSPPDSETGRSHPRYRLTQDVLLDAVGGDVVRVLRMHAAGPRWSTPGRTASSGRGTRFSWAEGAQLGGILSDVVRVLRTHAAAKNLAPTALKQCGIMSTLSRGEAREVCANAGGAALQVDRDSLEWAIGLRCRRGARAFVEGEKSG
jgi:hypothetical protein